MKNYLYRIILIILFLGKLSFAKQPSWIKHKPESIYFAYYCGVGSSNNLESAKKKAISNAIFEIVQSDNISIKGKLTIKSEETEENGKVDYRDEIIQDILIKGESKNIKGLKNVGNHWEKKKFVYNYWILIRVPKENSFANMSIYNTKKFAPIWRSIIIPGWGQFYKKQKIKGTLILSSEIILFSSSLFFAYKGSEFFDKENNEMFDMDKRKIYRDNKDLAYNISMFSLIGTSAIYIFNLYDSITSDGEPSFTSHEKNLPFNVAFNDEQFRVVWSYKF